MTLPVPDEGLWYLIADGSIRRCVRLDAADLETVATWCGGTADATTVTMDDAVTVANPGDWVAIDAADDCHVYTHTAFHAAHQNVPVDDA